MFNQKILSAKICWVSLAAAILVATNSFAQGIQTDLLPRTLEELRNPAGSKRFENASQNVVHDGPDSAIEPAESLKYLEVFEGQRIELAAHEPHVIDPVAMRFDDAGNMWVVELLDYPTNPGPNGRSRIRVLKDSNHDGLFDHATLFADALLFPTGLQFHRDGVLATIGGKLIFLRDTDGDFVCDSREDWISGFAQENPQLRVNDPDFGIDGSLYLANGLRSSNIQILRSDPASAKVSQPPSDRQPLVISNQDLRWNWLENKGTAISGPSQFGMTWDRYGNRYFCTNRNPCDAVLLEPHQAALSPLAGLAPMTAPALAAGEKSSVRPLVSAWTTSNLHAGQFTAACGILMSHSNHLPSASLGNVMTCEPTGSLVHRVALGRKDGRTQAEEPDQPKEWLASTDPWFRPVNLEEGPDGAIYVVDMHRAVIEHPDWVPEELKTRPDERWGDRFGRVYRILRHDAPSIDPIWKQIRQRPLSSRSSEELIELMTHHRAWIQNTAARLLYERIYDSSPNQRISLQKELLKATESLANSQDVESSLVRMLYLTNASTNAVASIHLDRIIDHCLSENHPSHRNPSLRAALWKFALHANCDSEAITQAAQHAVRLGPPEEATEAAWYLAQISSIQSSAFASQALADPKFIESSALRCVNLADDPYWLMAVTAMHRNNLTSLMTSWMHHANQALKETEMKRSFSTSAWTRLAAVAANPEIPLWLISREDWKTNLNALLTTGPDDDQARRQGVDEPQLNLHLAIAIGIASSADRNWLANQTSLWEGFENALGDNRWSDSIRNSLSQLLGMTITPDQSRRSSEALRMAIERTNEPYLRRQLLVAWAQHPDELSTGQSCSDWMLERFQAETPAMRNVMFQAIRNRPERLERWLDAIEAGEISDKGLDALQIQSLSQVSGLLQPRIAKWLTDRIRTDRHQVLQEYMSCLDLKTDFQRGKQLFAQHCAACHRIDGVGTTIGPDISDSRTQSSSQLLVSILDPNRVIDNNYFRIIVRMADGTLHEGIIVEESAEHLILKNQQTPKLILQRNEIDAIQSSGLSLMPEGIEIQLNHQAMADLIGYIKNWRYVGGTAPSLPENR